MTISTFLVYYGLKTDLDAITIYRHIKTLDNLNEPAIQELLTFLLGCMASRILNDMGTFIHISVFMEATPTEACKWGLKAFNTTFPTLYTQYQEPGPDQPPPAASPDINLNLFQHFISDPNLQGIPPPPSIDNVPT